MPPAPLTADPVGADPRDAVFDTAAIMDGLAQRAGAASMLILAMTALKLVLQFASIAVLARLVGPGEQGVIAMVMPVVMVSMTLSNFGLSQAMMQRPVMTHALASTLFWVNAAFGVAAMGLVMALAYPAARFYGEPRVAAVFLALSGMVLLSAMAGQYIAILRRRMRIREAELTNLGGMVAGIVVAVVLARAGWSYWAIVAQQLVMSATLLGLLVATTGWVPSAPWRQSFAPARAALAFGGYLAGANLLKMATDNVAMVVAGRAFGDVSAGLFYRAQTLSDMSRHRVLMPLSGAFVPTLSRLQDDAAGFRTMAVRMLNRMMLLIMPVAVLLVGASDLIVALMLGPDWADAAVLLALLGLRVLVLPIDEGLRWCCIAMGATRPLMLFAVANFALVLVALVIGAQAGLAGMALCYALVEIGIALPVLVWLAQRHTPVGLGVLRRACLGDLVFGVVAIGAVAGLRALLPELPVLVELAIVGLALALLTGLKIAITPEQRDDVRKILRRALPRRNGMSR